MLEVELARLEESLAYIQEAPADGGTVELIVRRPAVDERELLTEAWLDVSAGLQGDGWSARIAPGMAGPNPEAQLTIVNARAAAAIAADRERWPLAGDQLFVDLDISQTNLPAGTRVQIGSAVIEFSSKPHTGCKKFSGRFGLDALAFVSTDAGRELRMRGANCKVVVSGMVRTGDVIRKLPL
jgi:MOSC domain-containing protein YiiM